LKTPAARLARTTDYGSLTIVKRDREALGGLQRYATVGESGVDVP